MKNRNFCVETKTEEIEENSFIGEKGWWNHVIISISSRGKERPRPLIHFKRVEFQLIWLGKLFISCLLLRGTYWMLNTSIKVKGKSSRVCL
jgi:hypothetical protein